MSLRLRASLETLHRYRIEQALPSHVGVSVQAYDTHLHRHVVLRLYGPRDEPDRALAGARLVSRVRHPSVVEIHDAGLLGSADARSVYVAVERLSPSSSLRAWLRRRPKASAVRAVFDELAQGLQAAHDAGVVHGRLDDAAARVRPDGRVVLVEFRGDATPLQDQLALAALWRGATARWRNTRRDAVLRRVARSPYASVDALRRAVLEAQRPRRWPWVFGAALAAGVAAALWPFADDAPTCRERTRWATAAVWSAERAGEVREGLLASGSLQAEAIADRLVPILDDHVGRLKVSATAACEPGDAVLPAQAGLRTQCHQRLLDELDGLLRLFERADVAIADRALEVALQLQDPATCGRGVLEPATAQRAQLAEMGWVRALQRSGRHEDAYEAASSMLAEHPDASAAVRASLHDVRLETLRKRRDFDGALEEAKATYGLAIRARLPELQVRAAAAAVSIEGLDLRNAAQADAWLLQARRALAASGGDPVLEATIDAAEANLAYGRGDYEHALVLVDRAVASRSQALGSGDASVFKLRNNRAGILQALRRIDEAEVELRTLLRFQEEAYGSMNATVAQTHNNIGSSMLNTARFEDAVQTLGRAIEIWSATKGPAYADLGQAYTNLGTAHAQLGQAEQAFESLTAAVDVWTEAFGAENYRVGLARNNLAYAFLLEQRYGDVVGQAQEALRILVANYGPDHPDNVYPVTNLAMAKLGLGELEDAMRWAQEGVRLVRGREAELRGEHVQAMQTYAEVALGVARASPRDPLAGQEALGALRAACRLMDDLPATLQGRVRCHVLHAEAMLDFEAEGALEQGARALALLDEDDAVGAEHVEARARLVAHLGGAEP